MNEFYSSLEKIVLGDITRTIFFIGVIISILVIIASFLTRNEIYNEKEYYDRHGEPK
ncbi:MAG: hypothetical protein ACJ0OQ_01165 [Candidatus Marisimplicoccus sp.]